VALTRLDASRKEVSHELPQFLPDGQHYIFLAASSDPGAGGIYARSLGDPIGKPSRPIVKTDYGAQFVPSADGRRGWLLYLHGGLAARAFDTDKLTLTGQEIGVPATIGTAYRTALFSASPEMLVYRAGGSKRVTQLEWVDMKSGKPMGVAGESGVITNPIISPDEKRVAYTKDDESGTSDIWILDLERGASRRLTLGGTNHNYPGWSPDGSEVVYSELVNGLWRMAKKRVDGTGGEIAVLSEAGMSLRPDSWSPDGKFLLFDRAKTNVFVKPNLAVLPLTGGGKPIAFSETENIDEIWGAFSPDGHYVAYTSDETGRFEVYVRTFGLDSGGRPAGKWIVSRDGGISPQWTRDERRLLWYQNGAVWGATVELTHGFRAGVPERMYPVPQALAGAAFGTSRGEGLVLNPVSQILDEPIEVVVNWMAAARGK
jgi:hypothetical protein